MYLSHIKESVQKTAEAISSVIGVDVTVTDDMLIRIAGTGKYKHQIGEHVYKRGVFANCLQNNAPYIVRNAKEDEVCKVCSNDNCCEFAEIVTPIAKGNKVYGTIGLIAFNEYQKKLLLKNEEHIIDFLEKMANLVVGQIVDVQKSNEIKLLISQLQTVMNFIEKAIVIADNNGFINYYNEKFKSLFNVNVLEHSNINDILPIDDVKSIYKFGKDVTNKEFRYEKNGVAFRGTINSRIYFSKENNDKIEAVIFIIEELSQLITNARNIIATNVVTQFDSIIYKSSQMQDVINLAKKASKTDSTVLITGESGTGKELFARALHYDSYRKKEPFIAINCSAIPENLFESELFGYEQGAYTGALKGGHPGKFELAHKGTLLLDEIGDMPLNLQPKLLRVLQDGKVMRIGSKGYIDVDVRIIASTNNNLEEKVKNKEFREDLYYRLNVIPISIPPLRNRKEDIEILVYHFIRNYSEKLSKNVTDITSQALEQIKSYAWFGNVRELQNSIEYAVNMTEKTYIDIDSLPQKIKKTEICCFDISHNYKTEKLCTIDELERNEIVKAIKIYGLHTNSITKICAELGISRATFYRKVKKYDIISISNQNLIND